ncbi:hypothetical protein, partial [Paracoccus sediminilitoris]|uniref:hypothetical protein n=1 Tax=Paracoccus sediminilitoris TaxID=2202419 RepID=UPI001F47C8CE
LLGLKRILSQTGGECGAQVNGVVDSDGFFSLASTAEVATEMDISKTFICVAHDLSLIMHAYTLRPLSEDEAFVMVTSLLP